MHTVQISNTSIDPLIGPYQVLSLRATVDPEAMAMKCNPHSPNSNITRASPPEHLMTYAGHFLEGLTVMF